jgi:hypothetical protein
VPCRTVDGGRWHILVTGKMREIQRRTKKSLSSRLLLRCRVGSPPQAFELAPVSRRCPLLPSPLPYRATKFLTHGITNCAIRPSIMFYRISHNPRSQNPIQTLFSFFLRNATDGGIGIGTGGWMRGCVGVCVGGRAGFSFTVLFSFFRGSTWLVLRRVRLVGLLA